MDNLGYFINTMILYLSIIIFNYIAMKYHKIPTTNRVVHIWLFTITIQMIFDYIVEFNYYGYWYFDKGFDWLGLPAHIVLIPPVNVILLSRYPFNRSLFNQFLYIIGWTICAVAYEAITLLPEPWGFFHLGWWKIWYDLFVIPILIIILVMFYKWICRLETKIHNSI